jgi:putative peptidoglycan lipid II flippase
MPIVQVLLERGAFGSNSTRLTSEAVLCYGTGLWAYAGLRIVQTAFYALKDARTPLAVAAVGMAFNLVVGAGLMHPLGHKGIALAAAGAAATSLGLLLIALRRKIGNLGGKAITLAFIRAGCCSILMGIMVTALLHWLPIDPQAGLAVNGVRLLVCVTAGLAGYLALSWLTNSRELQMLYRFVRHRDLPP